MKLRFVAGFLIAASAIACGARGGTVPSTAFVSHGTPAAAATASPQAIITLGVPPGGSSKAGMDISLKVGGGKLRPFLFDSGSQGFFIYDNALGKNYTSTHVPAHNTYGSGIHYKGTVVNADVVFTTAAGPFTAVGAPVVRVTSATCIASKPTCPAQVSSTNCPNTAKNPPPKPGQAGIRCLEEGRKLYGTFGVDLEPSVYATASPSATAIVHNLLYYIAPTFIIHQHQLQLGIAPSAVRAFTMIQLTKASPLPSALPNGARPWLAHAPLCFTLGKYVTQPVCQGTLFDTGASNVNFKGGVTVKIPTTKPCNYARKGILVTMSFPASAGGKPIASFPSGYTGNYNAVVFTKPNPGKAATTNTGLTFYNRDEIYFDAVKGRVGLSPLPAPGNVGTKRCGPGSKSGFEP